MRLALLALCLLGAGCWDFDALTRGGGRPDDGGPVDLNGADLICLGTALVEDCSDGADNDGDCAADCDDTECSGKDVCKPIDGLVGYGELTRGAGLCGVGTTLSGPANLYDKIDPNQKACSGCTCGAPAAGCASELRLYSKKKCNSNDLYPTGGRVALPGPAPCNALNAAVAATMSAVFDAPALKCTPGGTPAPNPAFAGQARLCLQDAAAKTCTTAACVLSQLPNVRACVAVTGPDCPAGFRSKETWYRTYNDPRTCACTCGSPDGSCEAAVMTTGALVANAACTDMNRTALTPGECKDTPPAFVSAGFDYSYRPKAGAACTATGTATGTAALADALTICCVQ
jgi:hypothetical protein